MDGLHKVLQAGGHHLPAAADVHEVVLKVHAEMNGAGGKSRTIPHRGVLSLHPSMTMLTLRPKTSPGPMLVERVLDQRKGAVGQGVVARRLRTGGRRLVVPEVRQL